MIKIDSCLEAVRFPSTWPATPLRQGDGQLLTPLDSASALTTPPASVKTVEFGSIIRIFRKRRSSIVLGVRGGGRGDETDYDIDISLFKPFWQPNLFSSLEVISV